MKKILFLLLILFILPITCYSLELPIEVSAKGVALYDITHDQFIYSKNLDQSFELASLTKMYTEYITILNNYNLNKKVKITKDSFYHLEAFTKIGLEEGEVLTLNELLYASNLNSGADATQALANGTTKNVNDFVFLMNATVKGMGLYNTHFETTYGGSNNDTSTPREVVYFLKEALQNKDFKRVFSAKYLRLSNGLEAINYTRTIASFYGYDPDLLTGQKAGYTDDAGMLLASTATINGIDYICVVFKSKVLHIPNEKWHIKDTYDIYNYLKDKEYKPRTILQKGDYIATIPVENSTISEYILNSDDELTLVLNEEEYNNINIDYHIIDKISDKTKKTASLGHIDIYIGDELIYTYKVELKDKIFNQKGEYHVKAYIFILLFICLIGLFLFNLKNKE